MEPLPRLIWFLTIELRHLAYCSSCGMEVKVPVFFCPSCGGRLQETAPPISHLGTSGLSRRRRHRYGLIVVLVLIYLIAATAVASAASYGIGELSSAGTRVVCFTPIGKPAYSGSGNYPFLRNGQIIYFFAGPVWMTLSVEYGVRNPSLVAITAEWQHVSFTITGDGFKLEDFGHSSFVIHPRSTAHPVLNFTFGMTDWVNRGVQVYTNNPSENLTYILSNLLLQSTLATNVTATYQALGFVFSSNSHASSPVSSRSTNRLPQADFLPNC